MCMGSGAPAPVEMEEPDLASIRTAEADELLKPRYRDRPAAKRRESLLLPVSTMKPGVKL